MNTEDQKTLMIGDLLIPQRVPYFKEMCSQKICDIGLKEK